jgi:hypothetical protein
MATGSSKAIAVLWLLLAVLCVFTIVGGGVVVATDPTAQNAFRWVMAMFFIGGVTAYMWPHARPTIRTFFKR